MTEQHGRLTDDRNTWTQKESDILFKLYATHGQTSCLRLELVAPVCALRRGGRSLPPTASWNGGRAATPSRRHLMQTNGTWCASY